MDAHKNNNIYTFAVCFHLTIRETQRRKRNVDFPIGWPHSHINEKLYEKLWPFLFDQSNADFTFLSHHRQGWMVRTINKNLLGSCFTFAFSGELITKIGYRFLRRHNLVGDIEAAQLASDKLDAQNL